ncbi:MIP/aquaporin family protein [Parasphingopyxis sp. CP4]|uniref:aquaporin n=1 Tax=Parasphingopyxis sp. CP4 TaxID=2724527 RepID=UPI002107D3BD|nr:MIP/aquaporin family protein [Parasphingopyxis sp. CP4]
MADEMTAEPDLARRLAAEAVGSFFLFCVVIGSGIMGETLSGGNVAIALLGNTLATGAILFVIILIFAPLSGAHFNPAVTLVFLVRRELSVRDAILYVLAQLVGGIIGVWAAHLMFDLDILQFSTKARTGTGQWAGEAIATFGLLMTILGAVRYRPTWVAPAVGLYISAGYWFTSSTSFANPAITIARGLSDTFAGIAPADIGPFLIAQIFGALIAAGLGGWLFSQQTSPDSAKIRA